jgi:phosphatidylinositol alpha-1,6-mannosyltransferase
VITPDFPPARGGIQLLTHRLAGEMGAFETKVLTLDCEGAERFDASSGVATRRAQAIGGPRALSNALLNAAAVREALRYRPRATLAVHIVASPAAAAIRGALGTRTAQYFHAKEIGNRPRLAAFAARHADATIAVSAYTAELIAACAGPSVYPALIPPGVDLPDLPADRAGEPRDRSQQSAPATGCPTLLTISRLEDRYKGHDVLLRALVLVRERVPDVKWVVIGDGSLRPELERLARVHGVAGSVRFLGAVSDEQRDRWLRRTDLLAMPSRLPGGGRAGEGFGIVYLEAGAHSKPVLAGNVAGALDAVLDGETGLLVDPTDHWAVAEAIVRLLCDRALARRLGEAGARRAQDFAWPRIAARVQAVLLAQLEQPGLRAKAVA